LTCFAVGQAVSTGGTIEAGLVQFKDLLLMRRRMQPAVGPRVVEQLQVAVAQQRAAGTRVVAGGRGEDKTPWAESLAR
jgi:hypothetical protein